MIRFTIITVTYNAAPVLGRTLASVCGQTYEGIEYIVVDGGSTDGTLGLVGEYGRIARVVSERDKGLYDAMNKGLGLATGDYVWFINAGDVLPTASTVGEVAEGVGVEGMPDVIYGETLVTDEVGGVLGVRRLRAPEGLNWRSFRQGMLVSHQSFIVRREIAPKYDERYRYSSDVDWCIRSLQSAQAVHNTGRVLSHYLDGGLSTRRRWASLVERFKIQSRYYGVLWTVLRHVQFAVRFALSQGRNYVPVLACSLISLGAWGQSADDLLSKASARYGQAGGVSVEFAVHSRVGGGEESFAGRLRMQGDKFALSTPELYIWYDGRVQWTYWVQNEEVMVSEPTEVELQATNPAVILRDRKGYRAKLVKEEVSPGGRAGCVIELVPIKQAAGEGAASVITVRMEKSPPLPYQIEVKTLSGAVTRIGLQSLKPLGGDTVFRFERSKYPSASVIDLR